MISKKKFKKLLCSWEDTEKYNKKLQKALLPNNK